MKFRTLRAFIEVVRQGGFSPAARTLFATQSTVSKAVHQLEQELGTPLLERGGHRPVLTPAGEAVFRRGAKLLADRDDLLGELDEIQGIRRGLLKLGLPPLGSSLLFAPLFARFRQRYPGIEIELSEHGSRELEERLRSGALHFAAAILPVAAEFDSEPITRQTLMVSLPSDHRLAARSSLRLTDLRDTPFILFDHGFALQRIVLDGCARHHFQPQVAARSSQVDFIVELVAAGLGVTFLPAIIASQFQSPQVRHLPLDEPGIEWTMAMAWRRGAYLSGAAQAWLDLLRESKDLAQPAQ
ncbi:LysR family transcriptional regulator [Sphingomonas abietis]|uniref:LysR family transcriptional regulator n=1 Tax=Sphingomonas abietis TaxID=3012344 RepID=A0ABY7NN18_9SPHN|nr:LysR family transcriptional regulator [Sphingomonas abietis]WBO22916.1 LysR family transcriptional regulator [Sphingomonas abietis]